jgi:hypothetical protein
LRRSRFWSGTSLGCSPMTSARISIYRSLTSHGSRAIWLRDLNSPTSFAVTARWSARGAARWPQHRIRP